MSTLLQRRCFCCGALAIPLAAMVPTGDAAAAGRPFCRYSVRDGWTDEGPAEYVTRKARRNDPSGVPQVVDEIRRKLSIRADFDIYIAEAEDNAFATVANGRKILVVDVGFLDKLNRIARTEWGAIQVIAHEIGHHIAGFNANRHRSELNADYWSGQSLQRLGSSKTASTRAILAVGTDTDTPSHPNKRRRAATIEQGWEDAAGGQIDYSFCDDCR